MEIVARESEKFGVLVIKLLEVRVFDFSDDFILECFIHCPRILIYYPFFFILTLGLVSEGHGSVRYYHGLYSWVGRVGPRHGHEGGVYLRLHYDSGVTVVSPFLWCWKGCRVFI